MENEVAKACDAALSKRTIIERGLPIGVFPHLSQFGLTDAKDLRLA
jgi:hypothetical protein